MDRAEFIELASGLFGEGWQSPLAAVTGIAPRSIRRMASGEKPIPPQLATALDRADEVLDLIEELTERHGSPDAIDFTISAPGQLNEWVRALVVASLERQP